MNKEQVLGFIRHAFTFGGGIAVAKGILDEGTVTLIVGGVVAIAGIAWSIVDKIKGK
jgi:hypothetical protein